MRLLSWKFCRSDRGINDAQEIIVRSPAAPGARKRERSRARRIARRLLIGGLGFLLVLGIAGAAAYWKLNGNIDDAPLQAHAAADTTPKGATNLLFIGSDSRALKSKGYGNESGQRSDALMLVHFSKNNTRIDAVQIPRDTLTELPQCTSKGKVTFGGGANQMINSALAGGPGCSVRAVEKLSGVRIDHFVQLDFDGFASMVNALGGVNVCLNEPMVDSLAKLNLPAGKQKLNGKNTLALARTRHAVGDGSDIGRLGHQQIVMSSIIKQARSAGTLTRPDRLFKFLNALTSSITVDKGISSIPKLTSLAKRARAVDSSHIRFITMPNGAAPLDAARVVPTPDADVVFAAIRKDQPVAIEGQTKDAEVRTSPVRILNAARTQGLATSAQTSMTELGYTISELGDAEEPSDTTRIFVDGTPAALATAKSINKDFGFKAEIVQQDITGVWLILGADRVTAGTEPVKPAPIKATSRSASDSICT